jgi:hypothetical protein
MSETKEMASLKYINLSEESMWNNIFTADSYRIKTENKKWKIKNQARFFKKLSHKNK